MNSDAALVEMKTMIAKLKADSNSELKSEMKSLHDEMKNGFERLEEKVTTLNETVKKLESRLEEAGQALQRTATLLQGNCYSSFCKVISIYKRNAKIWKTERHNNLRIIG